MSGEPWFDEHDWPLYSGGSPTPDAAIESVSESGLRYVIALDVGRDRRCRAESTRPLMTLDGLVHSPVRCFMPVGHDTPHLPMDVSMIREHGPFIVESIERTSDAAGGER